MWAEQARNSGGFVHPKSGADEVNSFVNTRDGGDVAQRNSKTMNRKRQLSPRELKQLTLWGGLLFIIFLGLVYFLVSTGAIIPGHSGITASGGVVNTGATNSAK